MLPHPVVRALPPRRRPPSFGPRLSCPTCGEQETAVLATRARLHVPGIWRRRACYTCGARFSTRELVLEAPGRRGEA